MGFNLMAILQQALAQQAQAQPAIEPLQPLQPPAAAPAPAPAAPAQPQSQYEWSPGHESFIDRNQYPNAQWMPADPGGGSEGAPGHPAGWYTPGGYDSSGTEGGYTQPQLVDDGRRTYWDLKNAGLWNLKDANSDTWKFLQAQAGNAGDVKSDPNALYKALAGVGLAQAAMGRNEAGQQQIEAAYREALDGLNPQFVDSMAKAAGENTMGYWTASKQAEGQGFMKDLGDVGNVYRDMFTQTPLGVALGAYMLAPVAAGAAAGAGEGVAATAGYAGQGALAGLGPVAGGATVGGGLAALGGGNLEDIAKGAGLGAAGGAVAGELAGDTGTGMEDLAVGGSGEFMPDEFDLTGLEGFTPNEMGTPQLTDFTNPQAGPAAPQGFDDSTIFGEEPGAFADTNIGTEFNQQAGITPNADQFVNTNPEGQLFDNGGMDQYGYSGEASPETMAAPNPTGKGLLDSTLDWANKNPFVAGAGLQVAGGLLKGVGDNQTAKDIQERKIQGEKELQAQKTAQQLALEEERRKKIQAGSYFDAKIPFRPSGQPLRRPDGSLVYPSNSPLLASRVA